MLSLKSITYVKKQITSQGIGIDYFVPLSTIKVTTTFFIVQRCWTIKINFRKISEVVFW